MLGERKMENEIISHPTERSYVPGGAMTKQNSTLRTMTPYCVFKNELDHISMLNTEITIHSSVAGFLLSGAFTTWLTALISPPSTAEGQLLSHFGVPLLLILSLVFFGLAGMKWRAKKSEWDNIMNTTRIIEEPAQFHKASENTNGKSNDTKDRG